MKYYTLADSYYSRKEALARATELRAAGNTVKVTTKQKYTYPIHNVYVKVEY